MATSQFCTMLVLRKETMRRLCKLAALVVVVGLLGGCSVPYVVPPPPDPYPYSFSNLAKNPYPHTFSGAMTFINDATNEGTYGVYPHWHYQKNNYVQARIFSERLRSGDCDDYAVMMAYYLQEYWGYDTLIVRIWLINRSEGHMVCFVAASSGLVDITVQSSYPRVIYNGRYYDAVDFTITPGWTWLENRGEAIYQDGGWINDVSTYRVTYLSRGEALEWYELVNLALDDKPEKRAVSDLIPAEWINAGS